MNRGVKAGVFVGLCAVVALAAVGVGSAVVRMQERADASCGSPFHGDPCKSFLYFAPYGYYCTEWDDNATCDHWAGP